MVKPSAIGRVLAGTVVFLIAMFLVYLMVAFPPFYDSARMRDAVVADYEAPSDATKRALASARAEDSRDIFVYEIVFATSFAGCVYALQRLRHGRRQPSNQAMQRTAGRAAF